MKRKLFLFAVSSFVLASAVADGNAHAAAYQNYADASKVYVSDGQTSLEKIADSKASAKSCYYRGGPKGTSWTCQ